MEYLHGNMHVGAFVFYVCMKAQKRFIYFLHLVLPFTPLHHSGKGIMYYM